MVLFKAKDHTEELDLIIRNKFEKLETDKKLVFVQIGRNKASEKFIEVKQKLAEYYGVETEVAQFKTGAKKKDVVAKLKYFAESDNYGGVVVQYPFPLKYTFEEISRLINPKKDPDFFSAENTGKFVHGFEQEIMPPTVKAFDFLCRTYKLEFKEKIYVVIGQGRLVGRPIVEYLLKNEATVISINEHTQNVNEILRTADMVVCAAGVPNMVKGTDLKRGACIVDFSYGDKENPGVGDFDLNSNYNHLNIVSAVPGGMGPLTTRFLFLNFLDLVELTYY